MGGSIIRAAGEGERRWFLGGGLHTWKATAEETEGGLMILEDALVRGKVTPLHRHAHTCEVGYVIEGAIDFWHDGATQRIERGGTVVTPPGVPHAFVVVSDTARLLWIQSPGSAQAFYRAASEPAGEGDGPIDFRKLAQVAAETGATELLGPPPFGPTK